ncbi:MAG: MurR/RpiR family transcriptional regulator [Solobacterium sp.]|nr:MurR/RpiR family transcriptional regulator [Solobacterium sp.]
MKKSEYSYNRHQFNTLTSLLSYLNTNDEDQTYFLLAKYLLEHMDTIEKLSIYKVAKDCFVSRSSIHRFVHLLGFDSFSVFKKNAREAREHFHRFIDYVDYDDFANGLSNALKAMTEDINKSISTLEMRNVCAKIHHAENIILFMSEASSSAVKQFQQEMLCVGKVIRVITDYAQDTKLLESLGENDLMITGSASGNYAHVIAPDLESIKARKVLVTYNHSRKLAKSYESVCYLSRSEQSNDVIISQRNVYTRYGMTYFFDLLFHHYVSMYRDEIKI